MRRAQQYRAFTLGGGVTVYAIGMWFSWFEYQMPGGSAHLEVASVIGMLAGISLVLLGTMLQGWKLTNVQRALGGGGMIVAAFVMVWFWDRGINFLYLEPSVHGWTAGFLLLPLLLLAAGIGWLLMAMGGALRALGERR